MVETETVALMARARSDPDVIASFIHSTAVVLKRCTHVHVGISFFGVEGETGGGQGAVSGRLARYVEFVVRDEFLVVKCIMLAGI